jgi:putative membrane protein
MERKEGKKVEKDRGKLLILCVDRDDDLGRKTKIKSPIIGRENNLEAAKRLALADPEEADVNSIFGALNMYDEFSNRSQDVEVATICGSRNVGIESDMIIAKQLDLVLGETGATRVLLVSDGADDEFISPLIGSRAKIEGVRRIVVRQSQNLESTYYIVKRVLGDSRFQKSFLAPLVIVLFIFGVSLVMEIAHYGLAIILIVLALYFLVKIMGWERRIHEIGRALYSGFVTGRISLIMYILAALILLIGVSWSYADLAGQMGEIGKAIYGLSFVLDMVWFAVGAVLLVSVGKILDLYLSGESPSRQYLIVSISAISTGLIIQGVLDILIEILPGKGTILPDSVLLIILGVFVAIIGAALHAVLKEGQKTAESI